MITGLSVPQQYVCIALENLIAPLSVTLTQAENDSFVDVTKTHVFLGYKPLVIGIVFPLDVQLAISINKTKICLNFHQGKFSGIDEQWNGISTSKDCVARLLMERVSEKIAGDHRIIIYRGTDAVHSFIHPTYQWINKLREKLKKQKADNVSLKGKLHDMVRIAYSVPRTISVVTVADGKTKMNMFPTDLHGPIGKDFYISSLRQGGKANHQVERLKNLVVSNIDATDYASAYALGKNHMMELRAPKYFSCANETSSVLNVPLPTNAIRYRELQQVESFDIGIHRIHIYKNLNVEKVKPGTTLAHIHQYYAQWRLNHDQPTNMLLR